MQQSQSFLFQDNPKPPIFSCFFGPVRPLIFVAEREYSPTTYVMFLAFRLGPTPRIYRG